MKTSVVCMDHFKKDDFENYMQYEMGLTSKRLLVPCPQFTKRNFRRSDRAERRKNKNIVFELLQQHKSEASDVFYYPDKENKEKENFEPIKHTSRPFQEVTNMNVNFSQLPTSKISLTPRFFYEAEDLKSQIKSLQQENLRLRRAQKKQCREIITLKRGYRLKERKYRFSIEMLKKQVALKDFECKNVEAKLQVIFTEGQIKKLKNGSKKLHWTEKDIAQSITLYATSSKAYKLLYRKGFPIPAVRTLQDWASKINVSRGLIQPVLKIMAASSEMAEYQKNMRFEFR